MVGMVIHADQGLLVNIDAMPSEIVTHADGTVISIVGIVCDEPDGLPGLAPWKKTSHRNKVRSLVEMCRSLNDGTLHLHGVACLASVGSLRETGKDVLDAFPAASGGWEPSGRVFRVGNSRINAPVAFALGGYAMALILIGLRSAMWASRLEVDRVTLILDKIPFNAGAGMELLRAISLTPAYMSLWQQTRTRYGVDFSIANLGNWRTPNDDGWRLDEEPLSVLADWVAQSIHAMANADAWKAGAERRTERFRRLTAGPAEFMLNMDPELMVSLEGLRMADVVTLNPE